MIKYDGLLYIYRKKKRINKMARARVPWNCLGSMISVSLERSLIDSN